ncbi:hypothetical protein MAM1_0047c03217 [Mucor ambiguus]|uniref:Homeobox domain-containing protein n=1 Tax=Mucor ambiguus TaxID=91626 RepID=A0A0C9MKZ7_9FUNG|nr:hypothetical protein MAM1_0047c03217 [Mucor ambiguus]
MDMPIDSVIFDLEIMVKSEVSLSNSIDMPATAPKHMLIPSDLNSTSSGESSGFNPMVGCSSSHQGGTQMMHAGGCNDDGSSLDIYPSSVDQQDTLDINFDIDLDAQDLQELSRPSPTTVLFFEIMQDFPDLSSFVCHPDFNGFARIWLDYQRHIHMAQYPDQRSAVFAWLKMAALQLHFCLVTLVRSSPDRNEEDANMFSAFRRLKDRVEIMHSVINIVENGRLLGQSPLEAIAPLMDQADEIKRNVDYFAQEPNVIPVLNENTNLVELRDPNQVPMSHLSKDLVSTYNMMPYDTCTSALNTGANTPIDAVIYEANQNAQAQLMLDKPLMTNAAPGFTELTSLQPDASTPATDRSASIISAFYVPSQQMNDVAAAATTNHSINRFGFETPLSQDSTELTPLAQPLLFSHIEPSWIHSPQGNWHSLPVTPSVEHTIQNFLSYPSSPTCAHQDVVVAQDKANEEKAKKEEAQTICTIQAPYNTDKELPSFSPTCDSLITVSPINSLSDYDEEKHQGQEQEGLDADLGQEVDCRTPNTDDDDYSQLSEMEDDDDEWIEPRPKKRQQPATNTIPSTAAPSTPLTGRRNRRSGPNTKDLRNTRPASHTTGSQKARRTATSYDAKTTHYLKSIFFDIYSTKDKLTKDQRRKVQQETGLKPRNITYWFSNHKRRFQHSLNVFKKTVQETQGQVKTYDDFLVYRRLHGLPEEVQDAEFLGDDKSIDF